MKILIVDDEPHLRTLIQQTLEELEEEGVDLFTASNGEDALEAIRDEQPNLVFLDVMMPKVGADLYMTKPFAPDALIAKARSVLGLSKPGL